MGILPMIHGLEGHGASDTHGQGASTASILAHTRGERTNHK